jgi:hypothetical protein
MRDARDTVSNFRPSIFRRREALDILPSAPTRNSASSQGTITLTRPDGESVAGPAMVRPARQAAHRAWKLGRAVFDLTMDGRRVALTPTIRR